MCKIFSYDLFTSFGKFCKEFIFVVYHVLSHNKELSRSVSDRLQRLVGQGLVRPFSTI
jgi:hypothetical protein